MSGVELTTSGRVLDLLMYADDIVLIASSATGLKKKQLYTLRSFCKDLKLNVNTDKTKVCVLGRGRHCSTFPMEWHNP